MKHFFATLLLVLSASLVARAEQLIPAGSVVQCMVSEPHLSSKTEHVGDPVLCQLSHSEMYGRSVFPYGAYLVGRFEDYKDPGHFVGKGWIELKFDRMIVGNDTVIPISTRVVATSAKYPVDLDGKIHGTGHPVRDTIEWMIPILWPIDLVNLPRRGPYPELKAETRLTVMVLNDFGIPTKNEVQHQPEMISKYNYADNEPQQQAAVPIERGYPQQQMAPIQQPYAQPSPTVVVVQAPAPVAQQPQVVYSYPPAPMAYAYPPAPVAYAYPPPPVAYGYPPVAYRYGYPPVAYRGGY
jgi:hypothetical protein